MAFTSYEAMPLDQMLNRVQKYHPGDGYKLVEKAWGSLLKRPMKVSSANPVSLISPIPVWLLRSLRI